MPETRRTRTLRARVGQLQRALRRRRAALLRAGFPPDDRGVLYLGALADDLRLALEPSPDQSPAPPHPTPMTNAAFVARLLAPLFSKCEHTVQSALASIERGESNGSDADLVESVRQSVTGLSGTLENLRTRIELNGDDDRLADRLAEWMESLNLHNDATVRVSTRLGNSTLAPLSALTAFPL